MKFRMPWTAIVFLICNSLWAIGLDEQLENIRIKKIFPENIVEFNIGYSDGITKGSHAKLRNVDGYVSRALCLRVGEEKSHWRLYRIVDHERVSKDYTYSLISMQESEPDAGIEKLKFKPYVLNKDKKRKEIPYVKTDLPPLLSESDNPFEPPPEKSFWQKHFGSYVRKRETQHFNGQFFGSPLSRQSINDAETYHYGFKIKNKGRKYDLYASLDRYQSQMKDLTSGERIRNENTQGLIGWEVKNLTPYWSAFTETQYWRLRYGEAYTPKDLYLVGLVGFKYLMQERKWLKNYYLSYIPIFEQRTTENADNFQVDQEKRTGLRHGLKAEFEILFGDQFTLSHQTWFRPKHDFATWGIDTNDALIRSESKFSMEITKKFFMDYIFVYIDDKVSRELSNIPRSNSIQTVDFRYYFEI